MAANFYQLEADHGAYYRNSLKYLGVADINKMTDEMKQAKAFSIGISALLAKVSYDIKNIGVIKIRTRDLKYNTVMRVPVF